MKKPLTYLSLFLYVFLFVLQLITNTTQAQINCEQPVFLNKYKREPLKIKLKQYVMPASAMFVSGFLDGTIEAMKFHYYSGFKPRFKNLDDQYWDPDLSWRNKYKNGNPEEGSKFRGSTNSLVRLTDAYHGLPQQKI